MTIISTAIRMLPLLLLLQDLCEGGDLLTTYHFKSEQDAANIVLKVTNAVRYMHDRMIAVSPCRQVDGLTREPVNLVGTTTISTKFCVSYLKERLHCMHAHAFCTRPRPK